MAVEQRQTTDHSQLISPGLISGLGGIPYHHEGPLIRWLMAGAEVHPEARTHLAVHRVDAAYRERRDYCDVHEHTVPELNLILPITELSYEITLGDQAFVVDGPSSIFIPPGLPHSANVRAGSGFFVAIVLGVDDYTAAFAQAS